MIEDIRTFSGRELPDFDICIVGSGPSGLSLARELATGKTWSGARVCIVESGGLKLEPRLQALNHGRIVGDIYAPLHESRRRQVGGTANAWGTELGRGEAGIMYSPLDPIDFKGRESTNHMGWPISLDSLHSYYHRAQHLCRSGPFRYEAPAWETAHAKSLNFTPGRLKGKVYQFGVRSRFTSEIVDEIRSDINTLLFTHGTVLKLETNLAGSTVSHARIGSLGGKTWTLKARVFVLAAGGIETARLLLLSNGSAPAGLGNGHDLVGRFFMDHPIIRSGALMLNSGIDLNRLRFYDQREVRGHRGMGSIVFDESLIKREDLLNISTFLLPRGRWFGSKSATYSLKQLANILRPGVNTSDSGRHFSRVCVNFPDLFLSMFRKLTRLKPPLPAIGRGGWSDYPRIGRVFSCVEVLHAVEQSPHPDNHLVLDESRDGFGQPKIRLNWLWRNEDRSRIFRAQKILKEELEKTGLGFLKLEVENGEPQVIGSSKHHHIGTTRMSDKAEGGVVDSNCLVHGVNNLYITGSSTFPTGGYANPTLTIVALAIRLADHLKSEHRRLGTFQC